MMKKYLSKDIIKNRVTQINITKDILKEDFEIHTHDFSEIMIALSGSVVHIVNGKEYLLQAGDICVLNGDNSHGFRNPKGFHLCNIMYKPDFVLSYNRNLLTMPGFQALFAIEPNYNEEMEFKSKLKLRPESIIKVDILTDLIKDEEHNKENGYESMVHSLFIQLVVFLSREYEKSESSNIGHIINLAGTIAYMENNYDKDLDLKMLSEMTGISKRHFGRVFKKNFNVSPIEYVLNTRIHHACNLLRFTDEAISEIALHVGFSDINYFSRAFKKINGISPSAYRKQFMIRNE